MAFVALVPAAFVALVLVALVALVRESVLDHAIWTVVVVSHPVVTDHHHRHSLELVLVEAPAIEIADVIAHAMHFRLSLSHQQVKEQGAILVEVRADLAVQKVVTD